MILDFLVMNQSVQRRVRHGGVMAASVLPEGFWLQQLCAGYQSATPSAFR
jgi:hypothetical protein